MIRTTVHPCTVVFNLCMFLQLEQLLPLYFEESRKNDSEVWGRSLRFDKGEYIKIVAPSGSGKTSLMHFLYGIRNEYNGVISYSERSIRKMNPEDFAHYRKD